jgi:hypothetical protein
MKNNLHQRLILLNRSRANLILKNLYVQMDELKELRQLGELKPGLSTLKRALESFSLALEG